MRALLALLVLVPACAAAAPPIRAVPPETPPMPAHLVVPDLDDSNPRFPVGRVYPLGWSRDGLFAYAYEPPDEACGCYFFQVIVQDLTSGEIVWEMSHDSGENRPPFNLAELWREQGGLISTRLAQLGIVRRDETVLEDDDHVISEGDPEAEDAPIRVTSPGRLLSPLARVGAVLIEEEWRGWEGIPHVYKLRFEGENYGASH
jgi:hypothetical protein